MWYTTYIMENYPQTISPLFHPPAGQKPAIFVSQVRSAKAAPLTGSGKVPRSATVPAEAHLCLATGGGGTWEILRNIEKFLKKGGKEGFWSDEKAEKPVKTWGLDGILNWCNWDYDIFLWEINPLI
jgi:hypothetical protein